VCLARNPSKLANRPWTEEVEVIECDVTRREQIDSALAGCDAAYYLIHSMGSAEDFADTDRLAATNFRQAAEHNGVGRIVYLGGLGSGSSLSAHLASRQEVGEVLADGPTPVTELRAAVVIGSGSVSFEMLRYLTEVLPMMVTPRWVETKCQPIAIRDVLRALVASLNDHSGSHIYEIGGPQVLSYKDMMQSYARVAGLPRRLIVPVPVLSPRLSSLWIGLVTPLPVGVARPLVDSLRNEVVVSGEPIPKRFNVEPMSLDDAIAKALDSDTSLDVPSRWSDASSSPAGASAWDPDWAGGTLFVDEKTVDTIATPADLFWAYSRIGGSVGYYTQNWAWRVRGLIDTVVGGVGLRRGRRHPEDVRIQDTIDFWRVAAVEPGSHLQLAAEMKLPGEAWLEWRNHQEGSQQTLVQTAYFRPRGLFGRLYWYSLLPVHRLIFGRMVRRIAAAAESRSNVVSSGA
jgi:uncharacterized protein YbjT (DUF2867 family)